MAEQLSQVWLASTQQKLSRQEILALNFEDATRSVLSSKEAPSLRREGLLMYGLATILSRKAGFLLKDSENADHSFGAAFRPISLDLPRRRQPSTFSSQPSQTLDAADFDVQAILNEAGENIMRAATEARESTQDRRNLILDADISIDAVGRAEQQPWSDGLDVASQQDDGVLRGLLDGISDEAGALAIQETDEPGSDLLPAAIEDGDLSMNVYSSSPPPEVATPVEDEDIEVRIVAPEAERLQRHVEDGHGPPKRPRARRQKVVHLDEAINVSPPTEPSQNILRKRRQAPARAHTPTPARQGSFPDILALLDKATVKLLDPGFVQREMKRRRLLGGSELGAEDIETQMEELPSPLDEDGDLSMALPEDDGAIYGDGADDDEDLPEEPVLSSDLPEAAETEAAAARAAIRDALTSGPKSFDDLCSAGENKAAMFFELLAMSTNGLLCCDQARPFSDIMVTESH